MVLLANTLYSVVHIFTSDTHDMRDDIKCDAPSFY